MIATGRYVRFLPPLLDSARRFFCCDFNPRFHVWTDAPAAWLPGMVWHPCQHEPWPGVTLHRYRTILASCDGLESADYTFYLDADMLFVRPVCDEIFSDLVATLSQGCENDAPDQLPYESRLESTACVHPRWRRRYYAGAFQGGRTRSWLSAAEEMRDAIERDEGRDLTARCHDESHWNRYLAVHRPTLELSADYCCFSDHRGDYRRETRRILNIVKNAGELRA
jgi:histo-blood group ABO system transferase